MNWYKKIRMITFYAKKTKIEIILDDFNMLSLVYHRFYYKIIDGFNLWQRETYDDYKLQKS